MPRLDRAAAAFIVGGREDLLPRLTAILRIVLCCLAVVGTGISPVRAQGALAPPGPTLAAVRERGHVICAASDPLPGFAQLGADGRWAGFDVDFCRAVAAAVFGDAEKVEFRPLSGDARFVSLQTGAVDLLARNGAWTMRRDTSYGATYVATSFYDGQAIMVPASLGFVSAYELDDVSVCVRDDPEELANLRSFFFSIQAAYTEVLYENRDDLSVAYREGLCNAVSAPASWLQAIRRSLPEPATHRILPERISKEAFGPVVREGDPQWFEIVRWALYTLIEAEEIGVSQFNIGSLEAAKTRSIRRMLGLDGNFGPGMGLSPDFMKHVIEAVGNYGEIFDRNFGPGTGAAIPRGQNALWINGGLLYSPPIE
jgi:general L-amino acid transport system substrate-binding protein